GASGSASVQEDGKTGFGILHFGGTGSVSVTVVGPDDQPVFGADVVLSSNVFVNDGVTICGFVYGASQRARTGLDGKFQFSGVNAGPVGVMASQAFYPTLVGAQGTLLPNGPPASFQLKLVRTTAGGVAGHVSLPDGTPAGAGVQVTANGPLPDVTVETGDDGGYHFGPVLPEG